MKFLSSLSVRLTLMYVGLFCVSVLILGAIFFRITVVEPRETLKREAEQDFVTMRTLDATRGRPALLEALTDRVDAPAARKAFHALIDPAGHPVSANLPSWPTRPRDGWLEVEADIFSEGQEIDHYAILREGRLADGSRLLIGRDADEVFAREKQLRAAAAWLIGGTIVLGVSGALLMTIAITQRIDTINRAALSVMGGDLRERVPVRGTGDDFDRLAETLNVMLSRIEMLFEAVKRVSDSVAHELRTPLTRLIGHLDRVPPEAVGETAARDQLVAAVREAERLHRILNATLSISRVEGRRYEARDVPVCLAQLVEDVSDYYGPEAERRGIALETSGQDDISVRGDPDLLFQAISNLVDNALKFTEPGGRVGIAVARGAQGTSVAVTDTGPGLALGEAERVTERFYRGSAGRRNDGDGLGLSLVAAIADWQGARLAFCNTHPGLRVELKWPAGRSGEAG